MIIAVAAPDLNEWGCPTCGYRSGSVGMTVGGSGAWRCGECGADCCVLAPGQTRSAIGFHVTQNNEALYPELQPHPRTGVPAHGRPDTRPEGGGEFFSSRGVGKDSTPGCFVCGVAGGTQLRVTNNVAGFVQTKAAGERVVEMFEAGARLDYREDEPDRTQVKIGACALHRENAYGLHELTRAADRVITQEIIKRVVAGERYTHEDQLKHEFAKVEAEVKKETDAGVPVLDALDNVAKKAIVKSDKERAIERRQSDEAELDRKDFALRSSVPLGSILGREAQAMELASAFVRERVGEDPRGVGNIYWLPRSSGLAVVVVWEGAKFDPATDARLESEEFATDGRKGIVLELTPGAEELIRAGELDVPEEFFGTWERA